MRNILEIIIRAIDQATGPLGGVVNKLSASSAAFDQVGKVAAAAGAVIIATLTSAVFAAKNYGEEVDRLVKSTGIAAEAAQQLGFAAQGVIAAVGAGLAAVAGPILIVIAIVAALAAIVYLVIGNWEKLKAFFAGVWDAIKGFFVNNWDTIKEILIVLATGIPGLIIRNWDVIKTFFANLWKTISSFFVNAVKNLWNIAVNAGRGLIQAFVNGIKAVASAPFTAIKEIFLRIRRLLPFSDAAEGPLSDLTFSGGQLAQTFAAGIAAKAGAIQSALHNALAAAQPNLPAFGFAGAGSAGASPSLAGTVRIGGGRKTFVIDVEGAVEVVLDETLRGLVTG